MIYGQKEKEMTTFCKCGHSESRHSEVDNKCYAVTAIGDFDFIYCDCKCLCEKDL